MTSIVLALKLVLAPALVVTCSLAGRRFGPRVAGILIVLPVVAGPILLVVTLQHGPGFGSRAAAAATLGIVPVAVFAVVFATLTRGHRWPTALAGGWAGVLLADLALARLTAPPVVALLAAVAALVGADLALRRTSSARPSGRRPPWWDLPVRAAATAALVVAVTGLAAALGPTWTGVLAPFPIALSVVCAFTAAQHGHGGVLALFRGVLPGLHGFALFCFLVAVTLVPLGPAPSFAVALAGALAVAAVLSRWRPPPRA